jgi:Thrombospondin type 3 repeat
MLRDLFRPLILVAAACSFLPVLASAQAQSRKAVAPSSADADGDSVLDASDACPKQAGVASNDAEQNGCPVQADADGDGVPDARDACPKEPGIKSSDPKTSGCAAKVDAGKLRDRAEVTFTGYQALAGGRGIVFVELSDPVAVEVSRSGQVIEYRLVGATVPLKNNKNPLLLRDFTSSALSAVLVTDKPVRGKRAARAAAKSSKHPSVRLVVTLRGSVAPSYRMVPRGKGAALEVDLPPPPAK